MSEKEGRIHAREYSLSELMKFLKNKPVFIPIFQRGFVWKVGMIKDLYKSIMNEKAIGTFVIWKTTNKEDYHGRSFFNDKKDGKSKGKRYYVIDGQQRLLTLFFLFNREFFKKKKDLFDEFYDIEVSCEDEITDFRKFFSPDDSKFKSIDYKKGVDDAELKNIKWKSLSWFEKN